ncbi:methionyl-tRNA formyltransferase [Microterricola pindariensis]|uniref:Methionyl-tRNA formyltransferase n=1 Tax=Microterricola pindariensis TaxID=478010 RepID=A0ABX5B2M6_9MICO|nr:methionyl-tRNA formyltransferase [Microterricola pindariensis]PPL20569.1 methionyl-tRNA formyltransferase [Microterricola pindariensis]
MRLVFAGTPDAAVPSLRLLAGGPHEIAAVVTREDSPQGRKRILTPSPVAQAAAALGLPVIKANRLDEAVTAQIAALGADLGVIVAYGGLVREPLLSTPRLGWINLHFSLLPRWRGAAPVQRALIAGDERTGADVFQLVAALDAGDVFGRIERPITEADTSATLLAELAVSGGALLARVVDELADGSAVAVPQSGEPTPAAKLGIDDARLHWSEPAETVFHRYQGVTAEPGAFTLLDGARFKLHELRHARDAAALPPGHIRSVDGRVLVGTASTPLELLRVQPAGKTPMNAADWWRGIAAEEVIAE